MVISTDNYLFALDVDINWKTGSRLCWEIITHVFTAGIALQLFSFIIIPHLCAVYGCGHISNRGRENISFFYFLLYCCIREKKRKTTYTTTTTTIFYSHYSGTRRSRKKKETTENEMMENVLPQFLELTVKLMMLKLNCPFRDSAYRFGISVSTVSWIFEVGLISLVHACNFSYYGHRKKS